MTITIVCLGDSITGGYAPYFTTDMGANYNVVNSGQSGWKSGPSYEDTGCIDVLTDFNTLVIANTPKYAILMAGINDITAGYQAQPIAWNLHRMAMLCNLNNIIPIMATLTPYNGHAAVISQVNAWVQAYCAAYGYRYIDFYTALVDPNNPGNMNPTYLSSPPHPNTAGYTLMGTIAAALTGGYP